MAEGCTPPKDDLEDITKKMETHLRTGDRRRGRRPELPETAKLRADHRKQREDVIARSTIERRIFISNPNEKTRSSKKPFDKLERTVIPNLELDESAENKYLLVRILEEGYEYHGFHTVVEDHEGNVCFLVTFNFPQEEIIISAGCALIIKEPYYKEKVQEHALLQCDCPTDIIFLHPTAQLFHEARKIKWKNALSDEIAINYIMANAVIKNSKQWCAYGEQLFDRNLPVLAREAYRLGLRYCAKSDMIYKILRMKLLNVHFSLEYYEWVTINCKNILKEYPDDRDALYYLGIGYCFQRNFREGLNTLEKCISLFPSNESIESSLSDVRARVREADGTFNMERLRSLSQNSPFDTIDCADYDGFIDIIAISGKGRGLVLTKDVKKGDILIVSKAVVVFFLHKFPELLDGHSEKVQHELMTSDNLKRLNIKIYKNPDIIGAPVFNLFTGENTDGPVQQFCKSKPDREPICDVEKIRSIYKHNKFLIRETNGEIKGEGLFLLPSYLNHNCTPNVDIEFLNDVMVVTAKMNLRKESELVISYVPLDTEPAKRKELLQQRGIQMCLCKDCKQERRKPKPRR